MFVSLFPEKVTFSREKVVFSGEKVVFTILKVTFSALKVILLHINIRINMHAEAVFILTQRRRGRRVLRRVNLYGGMESWEFSTP